MHAHPQATETWRHLVAYQAEALFRTERDLKDAGCIPLATFNVLTELEQVQDKRLRMYDLSRACLLTKSGATKIVNSLEKQGYLRREKCPSDLRGSFAAITAKGSAAVRKAWPVYRRCIEDYFTSGLTAAELKQLSAILPKLRAKLPDNFMESACSS